MIKTIVDRLFNVLQLTLDYMYQVIITIVGQQIVEIPYEEPEIEEPQEKPRIGFK